MISLIICFCSSSCDHHKIEVNNTAVAKCPDEASRTFFGKVIKIKEILQRNITMNYHITHTAPFKDYFRTPNYRELFYSELSIVMF